MIEFESDTHFVVPGTGDLVLGWNWGDYTAVSPRYGIVRLSRKGGFERYPAEGNWLVLRHSTRDHAGILSVAATMCGCPMCRCIIPPAWVSWHNILLILRSKSECRAQCGEGTHIERSRRRFSFDGV